MIVVPPSNIPSSPRTYHRTYTTIGTDEDISYYLMRKDEVDHYYHDHYHHRYHHDSSRCDRNHENIGPSSYIASYSPNVDNRNDAEAIEAMMVPNHGGTIRYHHDDRHRRCRRRESLSLLWRLPWRIHHDDDKEWERDDHNHIGSDHHSYRGRYVVNNHDMTF